MAVSLSVIGIGVALLLRYGVPPLSEQQSFDSANVGKIESSEEESAGRPVDQSKALLDRDLDGQRVARKREMADVAGLDSVTVVSGDDSSTDDSLLPGQMADSASADVAVVEMPAPEVALMESPQAAPLESVAESAVPMLPVPPPLPLERPGPSQSADAIGVAIAETEVQLDERNDRTDVEFARRSKGAVEQSATVATAARQLSGSATAFAPENREPKESGRVKKQLLQPQVANSTLLSPNDDSEVKQPLVYPDAIDWVVSQSDAHFTLQLATASDADYLREFGQTLDLPQPWYVIEMVSGSVAGNFGLFYSVFETSDQAIARIKTLSENASRFEPWVRNFKQLRKEVTKP